MTVVVSDTSPLNYLVMSGEIEILHRLYDKVLIPSEVLAELEDSGTPSEVLQWVRARPDWIEVRRVDIHGDETDLNQLDDGERRRFFWRSRGPTSCCSSMMPRAAQKLTGGIFRTPERSVCSELPPHVGSWIFQRH